MIEKGWGKRLAEARGGVMQSIAAAEFGVGTATLSAYENEKTAPDLRFLIRLCERFGVSLEWIAFGADSAKGPIDQEILRGVIEAVEHEAANSDPKTKAGLILLLYNNELKVVNAERETAEAKAVSGRRKTAS